jgi:hypothetical protein
MKTMKPANLSLRLTFAAALAALLLGATAFTVRADDAGPAATNAVVAATAAPATVKPAHAPLTGAELYSMHCNRCHPERYPTERTAAQWKTIMLHMQVRANIPTKQSRLILQYLQENSGR